MIEKIDKIKHIKKIIIFLLSLLISYIFIYIISDKNILNSNLTEKKIENIEKNSKFIKDFKNDLEVKSYQLEDQIIEKPEVVEPEIVETKSNQLTTLSESNVSQTSDSIMNNEKDDFFSKYEKK